jgi:hypothetical protein
MNEFDRFSTDALKKSFHQLENSPSWRELRGKIQMEIERREHPLPPMSELFPNGGYVEEDEKGNLFFVPEKE